MLVFNNNKNILGLTKENFKEETKEQEIENTQEKQTIEKQKTKEKSTTSIFITLSGNEKETYKGIYLPISDENVLYIPKQLYKKNNDRIEITEDYFNYLFEKQAEGMQIYADETGYPRVREPIITQEAKYRDELDELETWFSDIYDMQMKQYERCMRLGIAFTSKYGTAKELDAQAVEKAARIKELRALIEEANA